MNGASAKTESGITVGISSDELVATITLARRFLWGSSPAAEEVLEALKEVGVAINDQVTARVEEFVSLAKGRRLPAEPFVVADCRELAENRAERLVWDGRFQGEAAAWQEDEPVNYYTFNHIITLDKGELIGTIQPPADPVNVRGERICNPKPVLPLQLDSTVYRAEDDSNRVFAADPGRVVEENHTVRILEVLRVPGDVSFETGNIDSRVDVVIEGRVPDGFEVKSRRSLVVGHSIEGAQVEAEGDVVVRRGIMGRRVGLVVAGGDLVVKHASDARIVARGDVKVARQLMNSQAWSAKRFVGPTARVIGGCLVSRNGGELAQLGNEAEVPTRVVIGVNPESIREALLIDREIERKRQSIDQIRRRLGPLTNGSITLDAAQQRRLEQILVGVAAQEGSIAQDQRRRQSILEGATSEAPSRLTVVKAAHPKVSICIGDRETCLREKLGGPVHIEKRKIENVTEIVAVNCLSGSVKKLSSERRSIVELMQGFLPEHVSD